MKKIMPSFVISTLIFLSILSSCMQEEVTFNYQDLSRVEFRHEDGKWTLYRNNEPYFIKGAHGSIRFDLVQELGGNSVLLYERELSDSLLDLAYHHGLSVAVSLEIGKARNSNYTDEDFIIQQQTRIRELVEKYHTHPAILMWIIGNELHLEKRFNMHMWREVNNLSKMIHEIDPWHPTTTVFAAFPTRSFQPVQVKMFAPDLDFPSLTVYEFARRIKREAGSYLWGINGPYVVTEWGGEPHWMMPRTEWDAVIEPSSTRNADMFYFNNYSVFKDNRDKCIGGYVFYWGQKQERTHTLFSLILEEKYKTQALEALQFQWTGKYPKNWAPRIDTLKLEGFQWGNHYLQSAQEYTATIIASDPDNDPMAMKWEIREEGYYRGKIGGDAERITEILYMTEGKIPYQEQFSFTTPETDGEFRLFVYVYDNNDWVATANIPFFVMP
jgi:hypothetical protein